MLDLNDVHSLGGHAVRAVGLLIRAKREGMRLYIDDRGVVIVEVNKADPEMVGPPSVDRGLRDPRGARPNGHPGVERDPSERGIDAAHRADVRPGGSEGGELRKPSLTPMDLLDTVGVYSLISNDGCACGNFNVQGIAVDISCGRGGDPAIRVYRTLDIPLVNLEAFGAAVKAQIDEVYGRDLPLVFGAYEDSREYRAIRAWREAPGKPKYEDFLKTFEVHER